MNEIIECPRCKIKMKQATRADVTIDYCGKCGGLWLDKGEMEKLLDIARGTERLKSRKPKTKRKR